MGISYILNNNELLYFMNTVKRADKLPKRIIAAADISDIKAVEASMIKKGYLSVSGNSISAEATLFFLVNQIAACEEYSDSDDGSVRVYYCNKLIIMLKKDRLSPKKCMLIPIQNEEMLGETKKEFPQLRMLDKTFFDVF